MHAVDRLKELEHRGYHFEAADASFDLFLRKEAGAYEPLFRLESFRVITEKREDGRVQTEATIKIWARGERIVRTAEGNGPVNALDRALRDAIARPVPAPARHRPRQLQGPDHRRAQGHRRGHAGPDRRLRRRRDLGHDRRVREHHRGELGGARGLARVRDAGPRAAPSPDDAPCRAPSRPSRLPGERRADPARAAGRRARARRSWCWRCCARAACRWARCWSASRTSSRAWLGADGAVAVSSGTAALHLGVRALGWGEGDEVVTSPLSFVASANCLLYEGATPVFCDIDPRTLNMDPQAAAAACGERTAGLLPVHLFGYPADMDRARGSSRAARGLGHRRGRLRGARRGRLRRRAGRRARPPGGVRLLREQAARDGRGRHARPPATRGVLEQARSERNQGRGDRHGLALARPARLQLPAVRRGRGARRGAARARSTRCSPSARGSRRSTASAWRRSRAWCCPARTTAPSAAAGSSTWCRSPPDVDRDGVIAALAAAGDRVQGLPALHPPPAASTASASASGAASSRSPSRSRPARWRCRSSPRWGRRRSSAWRRAGGRARTQRLTRPGR